MFSIKGIDSGNGGLHGVSTPIQIPASQVITETLVDFLTNPDNADIPDFQAAKTLLAICDEFDMRPIRQMILGKLHRFCQYNGEEVFCIAARWDDLDLAKHALSQWPYAYDDHKVDGGLVRNAITLQFIRDCDPRYLCGLIHTLTADRRGAWPQPGTPYAIPADEWSIIVSDWFEPIER